MFQRTTGINKILALSKRKKVIQGGTSASKTYGILSVLIDKCCKKPNLEVSVVSESIPHLKRGALKDFLKIMRWTGRFIEDHYNISDRKYTFANGSYMEFFSPESILGSRRNILYINEAPNISYSDYHQLSVRTSDEEFIDFNPSKEFWVQTELIGDENVDFLKLTYLDNEARPPNVDEDMRQAQLKALTSKYWENWWKVYGLGELGTVEGVIFGEFKPCLTFPLDCKWVCYGMDFGYTNDPTTLIKVGFKEGQLYLEQLIYQTGMLGVDIHNKLSELKIGRAEIFADNSDPRLIEELRRKGWNIRGEAKKGIALGIDLIKRQSVNIVTDSIELINEWRGYSWKFDKALNRYTNDEAEDDLNHCCDPVRYVAIGKLINKSFAQPKFIRKNNIFAR